MLNHHYGYSKEVMAPLSITEEGNQSEEGGGGGCGCCLRLGSLKTDTGTESYAGGRHPCKEVRRAVLREREADPQGPCN